MSRLKCSRSATRACFGTAMKYIRWLVCTENRDGQDEPGPCEEGDSEGLANHLRIFSFYLFIV